MPYIQIEGVQNAWAHESGLYYLKHQTTALQGGGYVVAAHRMGYGDDGLDVALYAADGTYLNTPIRIAVPSDTSKSINPALTATADGGFVLAYDFENAIRVQHYDADGNASGPMMEVLSTDGLVRQKASLDVLADGTLVVSYSLATRGGYIAYADTDVGYRLFDPSGAQIGDERLLQLGSDPNATNGYFVVETSSDVTALSGGGFALVNTVHRALQGDYISFIELRVFDAGGTLASGDQLSGNYFRAVFEPTRPPRSEMPHQDQAQVVELANGNILVAWQSGAVYGKVYSADGTEVSDRLFIGNAFSSVDWAQFPDIQAVPDGGFVAAYMGEKQNTNDPAIAVVRFDADFVRVEDHVLSPTQTFGPKVSPPSITQLADGDIIVSWENTAVGSEVQMQRLDVGVLGSDQSETLSGFSGDDRIFAKAGDDLVLAMQGDDMLTGGAGNDTLDGGAGTDTGVYTGAQTAYTLTLGPDATTLTDRRAESNGTDTLVGLEFLDFDTNLLGTPFDLTKFAGPASLAAEDLQSFIELYIAYFNRAPDAVGLHFWGTAFAEGTTLEQMASLFIDQDETRAVYPEALTNSEFATAVYDNVLGRIPDQAGFAFWVAVLDQGSVGRDQFILSVLGGAKADPPEGMGQDFLDQQQSDRQYLSDKTDIGAYYSVNKGLSDVDNAAAVMQLFDGSLEGIDLAVSAINGYFTEAQDSDSGAFLMPLVGVLDDPFAL